MAEQATKKKLICVLEILRTRTDEEHPMSAAAICEALESYDIYAERKGIYRDIDVLMDCGIDIVQIKGKSGGYYIAEREFELAEVKLLVDAVQASKFITTKKSEQLIGKLKSLVSRHQSRELQRNVFIYNRTKAEDEKIYYSVDAIHKAILNNRQISFTYASWTVSGKLELRNGGRIHYASPWALTWDDGNYYLVAYVEEYGEIRYYRVDKMRGVEVLDAERNGKEEFSDFDLALFAKKTFSMYHGHDEEVTLRCANSMAGVLIDRYGSDLMLMPDGKEHFRVRIPVSVSRQFFGWITGLGEGVEIVSPASAAEEYREYLKNILDMYQSK